MPTHNAPIVIFGASGQLARGLAAAYQATNIPVRLVARDEAPFENLDTCLDLLDELEPAAVINAAAHTNVDWCEDHQQEAHLVNAIAPGEIARWCAEEAVYFVHFSTDYVFDGKKHDPYVESDPVNPLSWYGRTKLEAEDAIYEVGGDYLIARVSWLYSHYRPSFVHAIIDQAKVWCREKEQGKVTPGIRVVADQIGSPTFVDTLAGQLFPMIQSRLTGLYHVACSGQGSRYDMAQLIAQSAGVDAPFVPCTTAEYPRPAMRPVFSALESARLKHDGLYQMPSWQNALAQFVTKTWPAIRS